MRNHHSLWALALLAEVARVPAGIVMQFRDRVRALEAGEGHRALRADLARRAVGLRRAYRARE
jgi:hypothetical protein